MWREAGHTIRQCTCGLGYLDPPAAATTTRDLHHDGYYAVPAAVRLAWVARFCAGGRLLEVGPGAGHLLAAARRRGYEVTGVDPDPTSAQRIRERVGIEIELATIETSTLPDAGFDVVVHVDLLAHLVDPVAALHAMARRLRPGGHLCFEVGLTGGISPLWYRALGRLDLPAHRWLFSRHALQRVLARAGLEIVGARRFGLAPALGLVLAGRVATRLAGRARHRDALPPVPLALYDRLMCALRYRLGRITPDLGPQTLFVAARAA